MRTALVLLHAVPGVVGLLAGLLALSPPRPADRRHRWRQLYAVCIGVLLAGMVALVGYDWPELDTAARVAFTGLVGLGVVMAYRLWRAYQQARQDPPPQQPQWRERYLGHVYFTYVSLWIGFLVVPALSFPLPQLTIPAAALAVLVTGHLLLNRYRRRLAQAG